jgi:MscS family membrane protein
LSCYRPVSSIPMPILRLGERMRVLPFGSSLSPFMSLVRRTAILLLFAGYPAGAALASEQNAAERDPGTRVELMQYFIDRTSPEKVIASFLAAADEIARNFEILEEERAKSGSLSYPQGSPDVRRRVDMAKRTALGSLDLSRSPEWAQESEGIETSLMLREILKRWTANSHGITSVRDGTWTLPGSRLQLVRMASGPNAGDVVFDADTVARVPSIYQELTEIAPVRGFDAYNYYTETPGSLFPPAWSGLIFKLPDFMRLSFDTNAVYQWILFVVIMIVTIAAPGIVFWFGRESAARPLLAAVTATIFATGAWSLLIEFGITGWAQNVGAIVLTVVFYLGLAFATFLLGEFICKALIERARSKAERFNASMFNLICRVGTIAAFLAIVSVGLSKIGIPVVGIVAGLGVTGLAVALAAKTTLENLLASIVLHLDGTVRQGDVIESKEASGVVEEIGMRSTRVRTAEGHFIYITNARFADLTITNRSPLNTTDGVASGPDDAERNAA